MPYTERQLEILRDFFTPEELERMQAEGRPYPFEGDPEQEDTPKAES